MRSLLERDGLTVDGALEPIDFDGFGDDRSPRELVDMVISAFSTPGDWVLDPFAGLGSTLLSAQALERNGIGFEINPERAAWLGPRLVAPSRLIEAACQDMARHDLPRVALAFPRPPD